MATEKTTFALFFGNRGFFPASHQSTARREMRAVLKKLGHDFISLDSRSTPHGAVETQAEGERYARFLRENRGKFGGVILCLPNFGDETGAVAALKDADVPILVQAYPDQLDQMAPRFRRDAFCGKISVMNIFCQYDVPFTALKPHTVHPKSPRFAEHIDHFDRLCRVVAGMTDMVVGAIGARTTAFKTVRIDELALQRHGITMEVVDLSEVVARVKSLKKSNRHLKAKAQMLRKYTSWRGTPPGAFDNIARLAVVLDQVVDEYALDALAMRCWPELQKQLGVSTCVLMSEMNDRGIPAACEVDIGNAVVMRALRLASGRPAICLDWNNNYGDEDDKCVLFHCGAVPQSLMTGKGQITEHAILKNVLGKGCSHGCNVGRIAPMPMTFGSMLTEDGELKFYLGEGRITDDPLPSDYFGCAGVAEILNLQDVLQAVGFMGHRHHVSITPDHVVEPVREAFVDYLGFDVTML